MGSLRSVPGLTSKPNLAEFYAKGYSNTFYGGDYSLYAISIEWAMLNVKISLGKLGSDSLMPNCGVSAS